MPRLQVGHRQGERHAHHDDGEATGVPLAHRASYSAHRHRLRHRRRDGPVLASQRARDPRISLAQTLEVLPQPGVHCQHPLDLGAVLGRQLARQVHQQDGVVVLKLLQHARHDYSSPITCLNFRIALCTRPNAVFRGQPSISAISTNLRLL